MMNNVNKKAHQSLSEMSQQTKKEMFGRIAVLMGGDSAEREVSLKSGQATLLALLEKGYDAFALDLRFNNHSVCQQLTNEKIDTAFIALHGRGGEDGVIQAVLETLSIAYTGCGVSASAIAMDKLRTKLIWSGSGLPTPKFELLKSEWLNNKEFEWILNQLIENLRFPVIVKPAREGSSIGINKVDSKETIMSALQQAAQYDSEILIEQWIEGKEYTAAIIDGKVLPMIRLQTSRDFYDYQAKYVADDTSYYCPCGLDEAEEKAYQSIILDAFSSVGAKGWGRVDFICDEYGNMWLIELNTVPGLTDHSLVPMAAKHDGMSFSELVEEILFTAYCSR